MLLHVTTAWTIWRRTLLRCWVEHPGFEQKRVKGDAQTAAVQSIRSSAVRMGEVLIESLHGD